MSGAISCCFEILSQYVSIKASTSWAFFSANSWSTVNEECVLLAEIHSTSSAEK
jgi:hypothetical protein